LACGRCRCAPSSCAPGRATSWGSSTRTTCGTTLPRSGRPRARARSYFDAVLANLARAAGRSARERRHPRSTRRQARRLLRCPRGALRAVLYRSATQPAMLEWGRALSPAARLPGLNITARSTPSVVVGTCGIVAAQLGARTHVMEGQATGGCSATRGWGPGTRVLLGVGLTSARCSGPSTAQRSHPATKTRPPWARKARPCTSTPLTWPVHGSSWPGSWPGSPARARRGRTDWRHTVWPPRAPDPTGRDR